MLKYLYSTGKYRGSQAEMFTLEQMSEFLWTTRWRTILIFFPTQDSSAFDFLVYSKNSIEFVAACHMSAQSVTILFLQVPYECTFLEH